MYKRQDLAIDHVIPVIQGGDNSESNLVACCARENKNRVGVCRPGFFASAPRAASSGEGRLVEELQRVTRHLMLGDKPVVGLVHGWAVGGGFSWTLNCDLTLWAESAKARLPEVGLGMFVSGGLSLLLPRVAGRMAASEITWLGPRLDAVRLLALGIAWRVVPDDALLDEGLALATQLAELPLDCLLYTSPSPRD